MARIVGKSIEERSSEASPSVIAQVHVWFSLDTPHKVKRPASTLPPLFILIYDVRLII